MRLTPEEMKYQATILEIAGWEGIKSTQSHKTDDRKIIEKASTQLIIEARHITNLVEVNTVFSKLIVQK